MKTIPACLTRAARSCGKGWGEQHPHGEPLMEWGELSADDCSWIRSEHPRAWSWLISPEGAGVGALESEARDAYLTAAARHCCAPRR